MSSICQSITITERKNGVRELLKNQMKSENTKMSTSNVSSKSMLFQTIRDTRQYEIPSNTSYQAVRDTRKYEMITSTIYDFVACPQCVKLLRRLNVRMESDNLLRIRWRVRTWRWVRVKSVVGVCYTRQYEIPGSTRYQVIRDTSVHEIPGSTRY